MATPAPGVEDFLLDDRSVLADELDGETCPCRHLEIGGAILVAVGVAADDDRLVQPGTRRGTFLQMIGSRKIVPPMMLRIVPFGDFPHFLQAELLHARLVGRDGRAFHRDAVLLGRFRCVDGDLVVGLVALLHGQVEIDEVEIEIGVDQLVLDELPDDAGHLVAVHFDDRIFDLDLAHEWPSAGMLRCGMKEMAPYSTRAGARPDRDFRLKVVAGVCGQRRGRPASWSRQAGALSAAARMAAMFFAKAVRPPLPETAEPATRNRRRRLRLRRHWQP